MRALGDVACQWEAGLQRGLWPLPWPRRVQGIRVPGSLTLPLDGLSGLWDLLLALGALTPAQRWTEVGLSSPWRPRRPMVSHQPELQHRLPSASGNETPDLGLVAMLCPGAVSAGAADFS